jgi:hypothetical protein
MNTRYRFSLPVCALFAAVFSFSAVPSGHAGVSDPLDVQVSNINSGGSYFAFVHLTDLHIGEGSADYGTPGYEDAPPAVMSAFLPSCCASRSTGSTRTSMPATSISSS